MVRSLQPLDIKREAPINVDIMAGLCDAAYVYGC
jgi:hypothetical protein